MSAPTPVPVTARRPLPFDLVRGGDAEAYAQVAFEGVADDHDARFDQYLPDRHVQGLHQAADIRQIFRRVLHQQGVGALVDRQSAARRQHGILGACGGRRPDQLRQVRDLGIVDLHELSVGRRQLLHLFVRRQFGLLARGEFFGRAR